MAARNVQFRNADDVVLMYEQVKCPAWSVGAGTQLLHYYNGASLEDGAQELAAFLDLLGNSGSTAIYTLRLYKNLGAKKEIDNRTPYNGSYNFILTDLREAGGVAGVPGVYGGSGGMVKEYYQLKSEVKELQEQLQALIELQTQALERSSQPSEPESMGNVLIATLAPMLPELIGKLFDHLGKAPAPAQVHHGGQPGQINGVSVGFTEEELARIRAACEQLQQRAGVSDVPALLERLVRYQQKSPALFSMYMRMLK